MNRNKNDNEDMLCTMLLVLLESQQEIICLQITNENYLGI